MLNLASMGDYPTYIVLEKPKHEAIAFLTCVSMIDMRSCHCCSRSKGSSVSVRRGERRLSDTTEGPLSLGRESVRLGTSAAGN